MKISLIGMSGSGKSYWSKKLQEQLGFKRFCCDDLIEKKLVAELNEKGYSGLRDVAKWMGQPFEDRYSERSSLYLHFEKQAMNEILQNIEQINNYNENIVIDTTGSVIYTGGHILNNLSNLTQIVYLNTPSSVKEEMYRQYLKDPKPVYWGRSFRMVSGESRQRALFRSYAKLLAFRSRRYNKIANITLDYSLLRKLDFSTNKLMEVIQQ